MYDPTQEVSIEVISKCELQNELQNVNYKRHPSAGEQLTQINKEVSNKSRMVFGKSEK